MKAPRPALFRLAALLLQAGALAAGPAALAQESACADPVPEDQWSVIAPLADTSPMLDLARVGETFVAVGDRGQVLVSEDGGRNWTQQRTPTRSLLTGVWFHDRTLGFAVGHDAVVLRTEDGGQTWCRVHWAPELERPLLDVWFENERHGIAVGAYGYLLRTEDGGRSWAEETLNATQVDAVEGEDDAGQAEALAEDGDEALEDEDWEEEDWDEDFNLGGDFHLNKIVVGGGGHLYLAAEAGTLYRSDDAGRAWQQLESPYDGSFFSGLSLGPESVMVFGLRGNVFTSEDAGLEWREVPVPVDTSLFGAAQAADGRVVLVGASGVILVSREGQSFRLVQRNDRKVLVTVLPADDGAFVMVGEPGAVRVEASALAAN